MHLPGGFEWVILLVIALLVFGGSRLAGMGKGAGKAIREFKEELGGKPDASKQTRGAQDEPPAEGSKPTNEA